MQLGVDLLFFYDAYNSIAIWYSNIIGKTWELLQCGYLDELENEWKEMKRSGWGKFPTSLTFCYSPKVVSIGGMWV